MVAQINGQALRLLQWLLCHISDHSLMVLLVDQTRDWNGVPPGGWLDDLYRQHQVRNRFGYILQQSMAQFRFIEQHDLSIQYAVQLNNELRAAMRETSQRIHEDYNTSGNNSDTEEVD